MYISTSKLKIYRFLNNKYRCLEIKSTFELKIK